MREALRQLDEAANDPKVPPREELDAMSRITELFRVAGSDEQQRRWNSFVNDADQVSLLTLISRGL